MPIPRQQIRGVLLEEAVLMLLRATGYRTVTFADPADPTLGTCAAGLTVNGRGACHQIDAIADLRIGQPFSNPQRLLVEAKAYANHRPIGLPIVRGAVGVLKDVCEFWVAQKPGKPAPKRYHYQSAIFSTSDFTSDAQRYAFAHDIYLLPLARSSYFGPVISALFAATDALDEQGLETINLTELRRQIRATLQTDEATVLADANTDWLRDFTESVRGVGRGLIATLGHAFHVFLTPRRDLKLQELSPDLEVRIRFGAAGPGDSWIVTTVVGEPLFTFDLPEELFDLYADEGVLSRRQAANLKTAFLGEFTAIYAPNNHIKVFNFKLDAEWISRIRAGG